MKILIIGGSRFVGPILINKLIKLNHDLTIFNRGKHQKEYNKKINFVKGDRNTKVNLKDHFDVVIDMCAYNVNQLKNVIDYVSFDYFINFGTAASYKKTDIFPLTESSPLGRWPLWGSYNTGKVECEKLLIKKGIKHSTIRPVYILGKANYVNREAFIYSKILHEERIILPGNGQAVCQFVFVEDVANVLVFLVKNKLEGAFNLAGDEFVTLQGLVTIMGDIVGKKAIMEFNPLADGLYHKEEEFPFANENFICSNEKLKKLKIKFLPLINTLESHYKTYYQKIIK